MRKTTITLFLFTGVFAITAGVMAWYAFSSIEDMRTALVDGRVELNKEEERARAALDVKRQLERLKAERTELGEYFFKEEDIVRLLEQFESLAQHTKIEMSVVNAAPTDVGGKTSFHTDMKIAGSWQDCMYFIGLLESLPFRLELTGVNLSQTGEDGWTGDIRLSLLSFVAKKTIQ